MVFEIHFNGFCNERIVLENSKLCFHFNVIYCSTFVYIMFPNLLYFHDEAVLEMGARNLQI